jgi:hypothetical protein
VSLQTPFVSGYDAQLTHLSHSDVDHTRPESVVERMALPKIRGGSGPIKVESRGFEG